MLDTCQMKEDRYLDRGHSLHYQRVEMYSVSGGFEEVCREEPKSANFNVSSLIRIFSGLIYSKTKKSSHRSPQDFTYISMEESVSEKETNSSADRSSHYL